MNSPDTFLIFRNISTFTIMAFSGRMVRGQNRQCLLCSQPLLDNLVAGAVQMSLKHLIFCQVPLVFQLVCSQHLQVALSGWQVAYSQLVPSQLQALQGFCSDLQCFIKPKKCFLSAKQTYISYCWVGHQSVCFTSAKAL